MSVKVPVEDAPPETVLGFNVKEANAAGLTVIVVVRVPRKFPVIVTTAEVDTPRVVMLNDALVAPLGMVTVAGTFAAAVLLLCSETTAPPAGAGPFKVAVPVALLPPTTIEGVFETVRSVAAVTVSGVVTVAP